MSKIDISNTEYIIYSDLEIYVTRMIQVLEPNQNDVCKLSK